MVLLFNLFINNGSIMTRKTPSKLNFEKIETVTPKEMKIVLSDLENKLSMKNLGEYTIGSSANGGKKQFMGDIDIVVDPQTTDIQKLREALEHYFGEESVRNQGALSIAYPINDKLIQVDFIKGNYHVLSETYHSPEEDKSLWGGAGRNVAFAFLTQMTPSNYIEMIDESSRYWYRYVWSMKGGLYFIKRYEEYDSLREQWVRRKKDETLAGPWLDYSRIGYLLLGVEGLTKEKFNSLESITALVQNYLPLVYAEFVHRLKNDKSLNRYKLKNINHGTRTQEQFERYLQSL